MACRDASDSEWNCPRAATAIQELRSFIAARAIAICSAALANFGCAPRTVWTCSLTAKTRYLLTIIPEFHLGYGKRPGVHLVVRTHAATRSLQFAANTDPISWYSHLNGAWIS